MPLRLLLRSPWWPIAVLLLATLAGAPAISVHAHGRIINDNTGEPAYENGAIRYGTRVFPIASDGTFDIPGLPLGARLSVNVPGFAVKTFDATETEVRLVVGVATLSVYDETTKDQQVRKLVPMPEARDGTQVIGTGPAEGGGMAVPRPPGRDVDVLVCAKDYEPTTIRIVKPTQDVYLKPGVSGCPPLPTPTPSPSASPSPSPSVSPTPTPGATP
jgi:hypothetical protein